MGHELTHVVQQREGRVKPTTQAKGVAVNDDKGLEKEADEMGRKVVQGSIYQQNNNNYANSYSKTVQKHGEELGQSSTGTTRHLVSDLSTPIVIGSEPRIELIQHGTEIWSSDTVRTYQWVITDTNTGNIFYQVVTELPEVNLRAGIAGDYSITVTILADGQPTRNSISLNQQVVAEDAFLTTSLGSSQANQAQTYRELINDFKDYIISAANNTGSNGISPLFLASLLFIEVLNRPKEGREEEIESVDSAIQEQQQGNMLWPWQVIDRSVGVGQIRSSTAAMVLGDTPWLDQDRNNRRAARNQTESNYDALDPDRKAAIFRLLKWPKSNINMAARLLTTMKNRSNRFPTLTKGQFVASENAVGIVASEYNLGPSDSTAANARPSWYGQSVWNSMNNDAILIHYFPNV